MECGAARMKSELAKRGNFLIFLDKHIEFTSRSPWTVGNQCHERVAGEGAVLKWVARTDANCMYELLHGVANNKIICSNGL